MGSPVHLLVCSWGAVLLSTARDGRDPEGGHVNCVRRCSEQGRMHCNLHISPSKPAISITGQPKNTNYYWFIITLQHGNSNDAFSLACTCAAVLRNPMGKVSETLRLPASSTVCTPCEALQTKFLVPAGGMWTFSSIHILLSIGWK